VSRSSYLFLNGLRVHYLHWDTLDAGQPVVLLHGLASNARIWELTATLLAQAGFALVAPDLRGHGLTDKPDGDYGFDTFARDLGAFLNALDLEKPLLVGHSWGGMLALDYAARVSVGPRAPRGVVLVDGGMTQLNTSGLSYEETMQRLTPPRLAGMPLDSFLARLNAPNPRWQPDDAAIQIILANFEITEDESIYPRLSFEHHMQIVDAMWLFDTFERFKQVRCPVLLVPARPGLPRSDAEGEYLAYKEKGVQYILGTVQNARVHWMDDAIHDIPLQHPAELAELLAAFAKI
jgi:pimeloyl-ACP methyl ester carboxylesterase